MSGRFFFLGRGNDPNSRQRYAAVLTADPNGSTLEASPVVAGQRHPDVTIRELFLEDITQELPRFSAAEQACQKSGIRLAHQLFSDTSIAEKRRTLRDAMIAGEPTAIALNAKPSPRKPWPRNTVNRHIKRLRAIIRWGGLGDGFSTGR